MLAKFKSFIAGYCTFIYRKNGERVTCKFMPVQNQQSIGDYFFYTADKEVVDALKKHPRYNDVFILEQDIQEVEPVVLNSMINPVEDTNNISYEDLCTDKENIIKDDTVKNKGMATAYLQSKFNTVFSSDAKTVHEMKVDAAKRFNLVFSSWQ